MDSLVAFENFYFVGELRTLYPSPRSFLSLVADEHAFISQFFFLLLLHDFRVNLYKIRFKIDDSIKF